MSAAPRPGSRCQQALAWVLPAAAWATYAPVGLKYPFWLVVTGLSVVVVHQQKLWCTVWRQPGPVLLLTWVGWMLVSAFWSPAPGLDIATHAWIYALPLGAIFIGAACPPAAAKRGLTLFATASGCVGGLWFMHANGVLPDSLLWDSTLLATGNQRIASSVLLALGAAIGCWLLPHQIGPVRRTVLALAAVLATMGLASQDRRSGMVLLPLLFLAWALAAPRPLAWRAALMAAVCLAATAVWVASGTVRGRFAEGSNEISTYSSSAPVVTSWGIRLRMYEVTAEMVRERPVFGHGLGSWQQLWAQRVPFGTRLAENSTPHNDYLMVAAQAGAPAAVLLLGWWLVMARNAVRAGTMGIPALMVWLTMAVTALANATLRDAKFALPFLFLAGLTLAIESRHTARLKFDPTDRQH